MKWAPGGIIFFLFVLAYFFNVPLSPIKLKVSKRTLSYAAMIDNTKHTINVQKGRSFDFGGGAFSIPRCGAAGMAYWRFYSNTSFLKLYKLQNFVEIVWGLKVKISTNITFRNTPYSGENRVHVHRSGLYRIGKEATLQRKWWTALPI